MIDDVVKMYGNKVRVVFRDFPLDFHDKAQKAAEAGLCANDQSKFWEMRLDVRQPADARCRHPQGRGAQAGPSTAPSLISA